MLIDFLKPKSILDYGCGKGNLVKALAEKYPQIKVYGYDPAVEEFATLPDKVDFIVCTDVLEHIPENELSETISRISSISQNVFFHLNHGKASAILPNGENAHCTVWTPVQYANLFKDFFLTLNFLHGLTSANSCCITFELPQFLREQWAFTPRQTVLKAVDSLDDLLEVTKRYKEIIFFPAGNEGRILLDYFRYSNILGRICCVGAMAVKEGIKQDFIHGLPVIPIEDLRHFMYTALFLVSGSEDKYLELNEKLKRRGCKNIMFVLKNAQDQIKRQIEYMTQSGQVLMWYLKYFDNKITGMERRLSEQNEISAVNTKAFAEYRNAFRGKKVVIVGAGPTLKYYKPIRDAIHIALNRAWMNTDINFDYLFTHDYQSATKQDNIIPMAEGFKRVKGKVFIGRKLVSNPGNWQNYPEYMFFKADNIIPYITEGLGLNIYRDICNHPLITSGSISFQALQFALFTYPKEIYLVGWDTMPTGHFFDQEEIKAGLIKYNSDIMWMKRGYARMKMFARQYYPDTEIISINPVGLTGLFKDIYTEEYQKSLIEKTHYEGEK